MKKKALIPLLVASHAAALFLGYWISRNAMPNDSLTPNKYFPPAPAVDKVLDGDTVVKNGVAYHVRGIDAAELGPWANCWAEAALGGFSKSELERTLTSATYKLTPYKLVDPRADKDGKMSARLLDAGGYDIADHMNVYGGAAKTDQHWNWCGKDASVHSPRYDEVPPVGPSLWWPSGDVFDPRAAD